MDTVFVVVYQEFSMDMFEVREVFRTLQGALKYIEDHSSEEDYLFVLKKILWE